MVDVVRGRGLPRAVVDCVFSAPVHINVGGTVYTTTLDTLTKYPQSKLSKLFDGTLPISIDPTNRYYFLDVNGSVFVHILDFLRFGEVLLPKDFTQLPLLIKMVNYFEIEDMMKSLVVLEDEQIKLGQYDSEEDNRIEPRKGRSKSKTSAEKCFTADDFALVEGTTEGGSVCENNHNDVSVRKANKTLVEAGPMEENSLKSKNKQSEVVYAKNYESEFMKSDLIKTKAIEVCTLKSDVTELVSTRAANVEMNSVDADKVRANSLEVDTLMAKAIEVGTLKAGTLETETHSGPVNLVFVRYLNDSQKICIYSSNEIALKDPVNPENMLQSKTVACDITFYNYNFYPYSCLHRSCDYGFIYANFLNQLLNKGYRFSSVISGGENMNTREYMFIQYP